MISWKATEVWQCRADAHGERERAVYAPSTDEIGYLMQRLKQFLERGKSYWVSRCKQSSYTNDSAI